jgi:hypothetical protein
MPENLIDLGPAQGNEIDLGPADNIVDLGPAPPEEKTSFIGRTIKQLYNSAIAQPIQAVGTKSEFGKATIDAEALNILEDDTRKKFETGQPLKRSEIEHYAKPYPAGSFGSLFGMKPSLWATVALRKLDAGEHPVIPESAPDTVDLTDIYKRAEQQRIKESDISIVVGQAQGFKDKAADIIGGTAGFIAQLGILRKAFPGLPEPLLWEIQNEAVGNTPGKGVANYAVFGAAGKFGKDVSEGMPARTILNRLARGVAELAPQSAAMAGVTAVGGGTPEDIAMSALIPVGFKVTEMGKRLGGRGMKAPKPTETKTETTQGEPTREELIQRNVNPTPEEQADISKGNQEITDLLKKKLTPEELAKVDLSKAPLESEIPAQKIGLTIADIQNRDVIRENVDKLQPKDIDLLKPYAGEDWADKKIAELQGGKPIEKIRAAAFYNPNTGEIAEGENHGLAAANLKGGIAVSEGQKPVQEGFVTDSGRFVTNKEAESVAKKSGQIQQNYKLTQEERILGRPTAQNILGNKTTEAKTSKPTGEPGRLELIKQGRVIPRSLGWTTEQRRAFNKQITGKESMSDMNMTEMQSLADALQAEAVSAGKSYGQKKPKAAVAPNLPETPQTMTVGGQKLPAKIVLDGAVKDASTLHDQGP